MSSQHGFSLVEMLVALTATMVVMLGIFTMVDVTTRGSLRVDRRVEANQRARPVIQRLLDELHSTCLGPNTPPVLVGSGDSSVSFLTYFGSAVNPTPDKREVTLSSGTLTERIYPATGGSSPIWTFSGTPSSTRELLTGVGAATTGSPPTNPPLFQYFAYVGSQLSPTPLPTPLSAANAQKTAQVTVAFSVSPTSNPAQDAAAAVSISDTAILRLSPASEDPSALNPPCA